MIEKTEFQLHSYLLNGLNQFYLHAKKSKLKLKLTLDESYEHILNKLFIFGDENKLGIKM
jgi:hypothetical protein